MKQLLQLTACILLKTTFYFVPAILLLAVTGCKKHVQQHPVANAGKDFIVPFPTRSVVLDGSSSQDPDGTITNFSWKQISGPSCYITNRLSATTTVEDLKRGIYIFELTVTDNDHQSSRATITATVSAAGQEYIFDNLNVQLQQDSDWPDVLLVSTSKLPELLPEVIVGQQWSTPLSAVDIYVKYESENIWRRVPPSNNTPSEYSFSTGTSSLTVWAVATQSNRSLIGKKASIRIKFL